MAPTGPERTTRCGRVRLLTTATCFTSLETSISLREEACPKASAQTHLNFSIPTHLLSSHVPTYTDTHAYFYFGEAKNNFPNVPTASHFHACALAVSSANKAIPPLG